LARKTKKLAKYNSIKDKLILITKGLAMGTANKVPGVSGGIVAFVAGFYEEFIYSLQKFNRKGLMLLFTGRFTAFFNYVNGRFLSLLFLGMIISYFSVSKALDFLIVQYELYVWSVFFGMIIGSVIYIYKDFKSWNKATIFITFTGICLGLGISFLDPATENDNLLFVFFCGMISITGMTLPGFSGSFILILLGNYVLLLVDAVNALYEVIIALFSGNFHVFSDSYYISMLKILLVFTIGSIVGLVSLSHFLSYVLKHYKNTTLALIMGFISGSLGVVWPWKETIYKTNHEGLVQLDSRGKQIIENFDRFIPEININTFYAICFILLGIGIVLSLEYYGNNQNKEL
jgi:putative membrane protein